MKRGSEDIKNNLATIFLLSAIVVIMAMAVIHVPAINYYDWQIVHFIQNSMRNVSTDMARWISDFGMERFGIWPMIVAGCVLASHKRFVPAIMLPFFIRPVWRICDFIHHLVLRQGPASGEYSFPSAHAMAVTVICGLIIVCAYRYCKNILYRRILLFSGVAWIITVCWSRVWLGTNYLTDVIAGCILGIIVINIFLIILKLFNR